MTAMLTVDFTKLGLEEGEHVLDLGCGAGRHTYEALRRGATVVALDQNADELRDVEEMVGAMAEAGEIKPPDEPVTRVGDARALPFADGTFDRVIAAEILEHIPDDRTVIAEIARVTRPGGRVAITVPRRWPEQVCWLLSDEYHSVEGGHIRIYRGSALVRAVEAAGLTLVGSHHAHALHAPYWWLKCAVGVDRDHAVVRAYHRMLVWDMMRRPWLTTSAERALNPVLGKSLVLYFAKP
jgi:SAM-dependent methyltransferase